MYACNMRGADRSVADGLLQRASGSSNVGAKLWCYDRGWRNAEQLDDDDLSKDEQGDSRVSYEDYAVALVGGLESPAQERTRFTVGY